MRSPEQLVHSRARVRPRYALMPLEGFPISRLPSCPEAEARVLASPALGAQFVQMLVDLPRGSTLHLPPQPSVEVFYFVMSGTGQSRDAGAQHPLKPGNFGLTPPDSDPQFIASDSLRLLLLQKRYE